MGGVPALLLVIAAGITYGWQPDREGGVEYIIQVPPDQIERLEKVGEITSVIDPEVRGHVSRVVIRVGNGPVPRETPANLAGRAAATGMLGSSDLAFLDASPVPIPEMTDGTLAEPIPGFFGPHPRGEQAVLKPDTNSPPGTSGYGYPTLPPTLQAGAPQVDQAGREIAAPPANQASSIFGSPTPNPNAAATSAGPARVPPPATRTPAATPPPFTGSDPQGEYARARAGGPTTEPTNTRDNTWRDFPPVTSATAAPTSGATSSSMVANPAENPFQTPAASNAAGAGTTSGYSNAGTTGLAPNDTYGKFPSGINFAAGGDRASVGAASGTAAYGANPTGYGAANTGNSTGLTANSNQIAGPDGRLTPVQVAAGAWSIDTYGRILDRQGRIMTATSLSPAAATNIPLTNASNATNPYPNQNYGSGASYGSNAATHGASDVNGSASFPNSSLGQPTSQGGFAFAPGADSSPSDRNLPTRSFPSDFGAARSSAGSASGFDDRTTVRQTSAAPNVDAAARETTERRNDPPSLSERRLGLDNTTADPAREVVAPQPLFNGLLLISLVANVYLIFWLKNLRIQFRELVAAKRMASSGSQ